MKKKILVITQLQENQIKGSSTAEIVGAGIEHGYELHVSDPITISKLAGARITSRYYHVTHVQRATKNKKHNCTFGKESCAEIENYDAVLMRIQPPFNISYAVTCSLLGEISNKVLFVNNPIGILKNQEKIFPLSYPNLHPMTLISSNSDQISEFIKNNKTVILKPINNYQGNGIEKISWNSNIQEIIDEFLKKHGIPIIAQAFIDGVINGDKRIFLLDGKPIGAINRIPKSGSFVASLHSESQAVVAKINERDHEIASKIAPALRENGLYFVGLDVIDGLLTEIGTTSPTGLVQYRELMGCSLADNFWNWIGKKLKR